MSASNSKSLKAEPTENAALIDSHLDRAGNSSVQIRTAQIARLFADWNRLREAREFPCREDFDVAALKYILGNLSLITVSGDPPEFLYRVHGTRVAHQVGYDLTGKSVDAIPNPRARDYARGLFSLAVERRSPVVETRNMPFIDNPIGRCEVAALPLSKDGAAIDALFSAVVWL